MSESLRIPGARLLAGNSASVLDLSLVSAADDEGRRLFSRYHARGIRVLESCERAQILDGRSQEFL